MYTEFEQDLILACKTHYGEKGIEKVIRDHIGYTEDQEITLDSIYYFISELYMKMIENKHLKLYFLFGDRLSPRHIYDYKHQQYSYNSLKYSLYDLPRIICDHMIYEIQGVQIKDQDKEGNWITLIELHEDNEKYKERCVDANV